jgi:hypothetical protein
MHTFQIARIPERHLVEEFSPHRPDQAFNEGMRERHVRHSLDLVDSENPQVRLPPVRLEQRIMIRAEMSWCIAPLDSDVEQAAHVGAAQRAALHTEPDQLTRALVHHDKHPIAPEHD